jgi:hypothetical protein
MKFKELRAGRLEGASPRGSELRTSDQCLVAGYLGILVSGYTGIWVYWYLGILVSGYTGIWGAGFEYIGATVLAYLGGIFEVHWPRVSVLCLGPLGAGHLKSRFQSGV